MGFPGGSHCKESVFNAGEPGSIPGSGRSPREENGNPIQYSCLENPMDRGPWWATVHGVAVSQTQLSAWHFDELVRLLDNSVCIEQLQRGWDSDSKRENVV